LFKQVKELLGGRMRLSIEYQKLKLQVPFL